MAKKRKSVTAKTKKNPYMKCMSGKEGQIHKERKKLMEDKHVKTLTPKQSGEAFSKAAKFCKP